MWASNDSNLDGGLSGSTPAFRPDRIDSGLLLRVMDEVDHGMLIIDADGSIHHANHLASHELALSRFIVSHGRVLLGRTAAFSQQIEQATQLALKGQRQLVSLQHDDRALSLALVPLSHPLDGDADTDTPLVLVMLSRQNACENLAVRMYARTHRLSPCEEAVLIALCKGHTIPEIARQHRVADSTVRTQIKALRVKTGCTSIRRILLRVHSLPPVMSTLRAVTPMLHNAMEFV